MTFDKHRVLPVLAVAAVLTVGVPAAMACTGGSGGSKGGSHYSSQSGYSSQNGVKPGPGTQHDTHAPAGSDRTKQYGNGSTAGEVAQQHGASSSTDLYGPGNSQPHKVASCSNNGRTHYRDVHAKGNSGSCGGDGQGCNCQGGSGSGGSGGNSGSPTPSTSSGSPSTSSGTAGASASQSSTPAAPPVLQLYVHKYERVAGSSAGYTDGPLTATVGDVVLYKILVNNQSSVPLDVTLSDPVCDAGTITPSATKQIELNPGGTTFYYCEHHVTAADVGVLHNVATATGVVPGQTGSISGQSGVIANVSASGVKGAHKTLKKVTAKAKPARKPVVAAASFTG